MNGINRIGNVATPVMQKTIAQKASNVANIITKTAANHKSTLSSVGFLAGVTAFLAGLAFVGYSENNRYETTARTWASEAGNLNPIQTDLLKNSVDSFCKDAKPKIECTMRSYDNVEKAFRNGNSFNYVMNNFEKIASKVR